MHGIKVVFNRCGWRDQPWPWFYLPVGCASSHYMGTIVFHFPFSWLTFLTQPLLWHQLCPGTTWQSYTSAVPPSLMFLHHSLIQPSWYMCKSRRKRESTPHGTMGQPLTIGRWELVGKKNVPLFHVSGNNFEVHSTWNCVLVAPRSNQLIMYPSTGFQVSLSSHPSTRTLKLPPKINRASPQALLR